MDPSLLDEFETECRQAIRRLVDEYGFSRERAKRLVFAELASARAPSPSDVFQAMKDYALDWDRGYEMMSVAAAAKCSPESTTREFIQRLRHLEPTSTGNHVVELNARRSMSFSVVSVPQKKRTLSEASMDMENSSDITIKRPAQKLLKKE